MRRSMVLAFLVSYLFSSTLWAQTPAASSQAADVAALRAQIDALKADYEKRIHDLETQLEEIQTKMLQMPEPEGAGAAAAAAPTSPTLFGALNPAIAVAINFLGRSDNQKVYLNDDVTRTDDSINLREGEIDMRVPIDPYADGVMIASFESDTPGEFDANLEEAYVNIKKIPFMQMPLGTKFQVGRFRPSFGKFNTLHTHDLPQSTRSLVTEEFLGTEGFISQGLSTDFNIPTPWDENESLDAKAQVLSSGNVYISPTNPQNLLAYLGNVRWFKTIAGSHNVELGWSTYWHPGNPTTPLVRMHDVDFMYRWKPFRQGEWKSYLLGGEMMFTDHAVPGAFQPSEVSMNVTPDLTSGKRPMGASVFTQWQFDRRKYAGVRVDYTKTLINPLVQRKSMTPYLSYYFSEFLRLRLDYEHRWSQIAAENRRNTFFVELNWIFGAHPPEPFWVNR